LFFNVGVITPGSRMNFLFLYIHIYIKKLEKVTSHRPGGIRSLVFK
jgi:hypothetical protein